MEELRKNLVIGGTRYSLAVGQDGEGPPGSNTPGKVGVTYLDTKNKRLYVCTAAAAVEAGIVCEWTPAGDLIEATAGGNGSGENPSQGGLTAEQVAALDGILKVNAYNQNSGYAAAYAAFCVAFGLPVPDGGGDSGGDDSGGGSGGGDSGGNDGDVSNEVKWTDGVAYSYEAVENEYVETDGTFTAYDGWNRTPYLYCKDAAVLRVVVNAATSMLGNNNTYNAFYDADKNFVESFSFAGIDGNTAGAYKNIEIPANAAYFVASHKAGVIGSNTSGLSIVNAVGFVPYSEVPA